MWTMRPGPFNLCRHWEPLSWPRGEAKNRTANPEKGGSEAQALLLVWSEWNLSESHYSSQMDGCNPALRAFAKSGCRYRFTVVILSCWLYTSRFLRSLWSQPRVWTWDAALQIIVDAFRLFLNPCLILPSLFMRMILHRNKHLGPFKRWKMACGG